MNKRKKRAIAGFVATCMVSTILSPALPAYAVDYGNNVTITFETGDGPPVSVHNSTWDSLTDGNTSTAKLTGKAGYLMNDATNNSVSAALLPMDTPGNTTISRPKLPDWSDATLDSSWVGYRLQGWETEDGALLSYLHPAFPYEDVTYTAVWIGDDQNPYNFEVKHLLHLNATLTENAYVTNPQDVKAGTAVMTSYKQTIPGYKLSTKDYTPYHARKYGESAGAGTASDYVGSFNSSNTFNGSMPNDDLTVIYEYIPDDTKKFNFKIEHVNSTNGAAIASAQTTQVVAGDTISAAPSATLLASGYSFMEATFQAGTTETIPEGGVYNLATANVVGDANDLIDTAGNFSGVMPNQTVTIQYKYAIDPTAQYSVILNFLDDQGNDLVDNGVLTDPQTLYQGGLGTVTTISLPDLTGSGYMAGANVTSSGDPLSVTQGATLYELDVSTATLGTTNLTITYVRDSSNSTYWARVTTVAGSNGYFTGDPSPQIVAVGSYTFNSDGSTFPSLTAAGFGIHAEDGYILDGWYHVNAAGNPYGSKLSNLSIDGTENVKIMCCFVEDPAEWIDISFAAGANGTISSTAVQHLRYGTTWNSTGVYIPEANPTTTAYTFAGWYDQYGDFVWDGDISTLPSDIIATGVYTAKFAPSTQEAGYDSYNRPDAAGSLTTSGSGVITVSNPNDNRRYVVTDMDGTVLAELSTSQINSGAVFTDLTPGSSYNVYEIAMAAPTLTVGSSNIAEVAGLCSHATRVIIPAVGDNASVVVDPTDSERAQIVISPADANTDYALLDEYGNEVYGWITPSGNPLTVTFDDLDPDTTYVVVTKDSSGAATTDSQKDYGTEIYTDISSVTEAKYVIQVLGGTVETITSGSTTTSVENEEAQAKKDDEVSITAPSNLSSSRPFNEWRVLLGSLSGFTYPAQRTQTITMPDMNVVMVATYEDDTAMSSNASIDYKVNSYHEGEVAMDMSQGKVDSIRADIAASTTEDAGLITDGRTVAYRVQFTKRAALASESNAVKNERDEYDDAFKAAFALDVDLLRFVDGMSRPVEEGTDPGSIDILLQIDAKDWEHLDYHLWQIDADGQVGRIQPLTEDPNTASEYGGFFMFTGKVDSLYVLSYSKTNEVTLVDQMGGNNEVFKVRHGEGLENSEDYDVWTPVSTVTDEHGTTWNYVGLSTKSGTYQAVDDTEAIKKNKTIYTYYESDDLDWNTARDQLIAEIDLGDALMNNGSVSQANKDLLQAALDEAEAVLNQWPSPTTQELLDAYEELHRIIESIVNFYPDSDSGTDSGGSGSGGSSGGSSSGGGGGSGGSSSTTTSSSTRRSVTYKVGVDGNWQVLDEGNNKWTFVLNSGSLVSNTWAYLTYTHDGTTTGYYYHFGDNGLMDYGWFRDSDGHWYYLSESHDGWYGHMKTGWHFEEMDQQYYYLHETNGYMITGWKQIDGTWYYFSPLMIDHTWSYNEQQMHWEYTGSTARPYGSMYAGEMSPDGYQLDDNGAWK